MTEVNRKIHVLGINSYKFEDLPSKLQELFINTINIAIPNAYFEKIKSWGENNFEQNKLYFSNKFSHQYLMKRN